MARPGPRHRGVGDQSTETVAVGCHHPHAGGLCRRWLHDARHRRPAPEHRRRGGLHRPGRANGDPIVSDTYFYNPLSELDVALAGPGQAQYHPVLRLGSPPLAEQLAHLSGPDPQPVFFGLPVTAPQVVARQAVALARNGTIFLFTSGFSKSSEVTKSSDTPGGKYTINANLVLATRFLEALPARYHLVAEQTTWSFSGLFPQSVYVFHDTGSNH